MSRKKQVYEKITALYCRISLDDGGDNESMSISNQKLMLRDFAEKHGMFQSEYYVDDGYTGRNFNRPSFQRMIADIEAGKIGCVITKDLSRLGRNYIEAGITTQIARYPLLPMRTARFQRPSYRLLAPYYAQGRQIVSSLRFILLYLTRCKGICESQKRQGQKIVPVFL